MKRITLAASLLAIAACGGEKAAPAPAAATPAPAAAAAAPMDSTMKMDSTAKAAAPAAAAPAAAAPAADAKKDAKKP